MKIKIENLKTSIFPLLTPICPISAYQVGEVSYDLSKGRNTMEQEEIELEQREKLLRSKFSKMFETFFKKVDACPSEYPTYLFNRLLSVHFSYFCTNAHTHIYIYICVFVCMHLYVHTRVYFYQVEEIAAVRGVPLEFDVPFPDLAFEGKLCDCDLFCNRNQTLSSTERRAYAHLL